MRHRSLINVWPAFADLMTVLAIIGLFAAMGLVIFFREVSRINETLAKENAGLNVEVNGLREKMVRNEKMFSAIQQAQQIIDEFSKNQNLDFDSAQSLRFGDDLVTFDINSLEPKWNVGGQEKLSEFCLALSGAMEEVIGRHKTVEDLITVQIEGHTDSTTCPQEPHCNWRISSGRAAALVALMRDPGNCPGGENWDLRSTGLADKHPILSSELNVHTPTRRFSLSIFPNYRRIITEGISENH